MKHRYKELMEMQKVLQGECEHEVTVRNINGEFHCRVFLNGELNQEAVCWDRKDIAYTCRNLLRWEDKCGNISSFAGAARERLNEVTA
jgi:hypothetical protein